jgi:hypothetical protein
MVELIQTKCQIDQGWALLGGWRRTRVLNRTGLKYAQYSTGDGKDKVTEYRNAKTSTQRQTESLFSKNEI